MKEHELNRLASRRAGALRSAGLVLVVAAWGLSGCALDSWGLLSSETSSDAVCGDGQRQGAEICDGAFLGGETCLSQGYDGGTLACLGDCTGFDFAECTGTGPVCGDGQQQGAEACDGADLGGHGCTDEGFYGGTLACLADCTGYDTGGCAGYCGDGVINGSEACDGADLGGETCQSQGYTTGTLACLADCTALDSTGCSGTGPVCGDGVINGSEECDGAQLGSATCATLGCRDGGVVTCSSSCTFDIQGCYANHDEDGDGFDDSCDNCPTYANPGQADPDGDEVGGVCEAPWSDGLLSVITAFDPLLSTASWTATAGGTWTPLVDEVMGSRLSGGTNYLYSTALPNDTYSVEATFHHDAAAPGGNCWTAVVFAWHMNGSDVYAYECAYDRSVNTVGFWRTTGGNWLGLANVGFSAAASDSQWKRLRVYREGGTVRCTYDDETGATGEVQISGGDVWSNMSGRAGLRVYSETATFTSFVIYQ